MKMLLRLSLCLFFVLLTFPNLSSDEAERASEICDKTFTFTKDTQTLKIPYCSNVSLEALDSAVTRAIIYIHGMGSEAPLELSFIQTSAATAGAISNTVIIAPQFLTEADVMRFGLGNEYLFWDFHNWGSLSSSTSENPRLAKVSSFEIVDRLLDRIANSPNITHVVIAGHSAGGQFVNRYAGANQKDQMLTAQGIATRYVVANPSTYIYFSPLRRTEPFTTLFSQPSNLPDCSWYNDYGLGLQDLEDEPYTYLFAIGADTIVQQYQQREVIYLLGNEDRFTDVGLTIDCASMLQGRFRLERGLVYYNYLGAHFGSQIYDRHKLSIIPDAGHSTYQIYTSPCGMYYLFDYNPNGITCSETTNSTNLVVNAGFELSGTTNKLAVGWVGKNVLKDKRKCNKTDKQFSYAGNCAFQIKAQAGSRVTLQQTVLDFEEGASVNHNFNLSAWVRGKNLSGAGVRAVMKHDGTKTKIDLQPAVGSFDYTIFQSAKPVTGNITNIKLQLQIKNGSGSLLIDDVNLSVEPITTLLPLPSQ